MVGGSLSQIFKSLMFGWLFSLGSKKLKSLSARADINDIDYLAGLAEKGIIKPVIERRYTLEKAAEAMTLLSQGHASGKVVIEILPAER
jgi:NADPH:quinone reductase-like Zn-dependent oxidoreductase